MNDFRELEGDAENSDTSSIASDRSAATTSDSYATCKSQQNTSPAPRCSWSVLESPSADPQHQLHEAPPFTGEILGLCSIARLEDESGYGSDCVDEHEGGVPLADYDQSPVEGDTQVHLLGYLHEPLERSISIMENHGLDATEPLELPGKQLGHETGGDADLSSDEVAMGTGAVDPLPHLEAAIEDWPPPFPPDFLDPTVGGYAFALLPQPSQNQSTSSDTIDGHDLVQLHASTSGLGMNDGTGFAQSYPGSDVPAETLVGDDSIETTEVNPDQPYPQIPSWWYFNPHNDLRNMSFAEYLRFWTDGYALQQSTRPNQLDSDGYNFPPLTGRGVYRGMRDRLVNQVTESEVVNGVCDAQGLVWDNFGASRSAARNVRRDTYFNQANCFPSYPYAKIVNNKPIFCSASYINHEARAYADSIPDRGTYFHFSRMNLDHKVSVPHFQLHHTISVSSKSAVFFPTASQDADGRLSTGSHITCLNPDVSHSSLIIDSANIDPHSGRPRMQRIFTLTAQNDVLLAGGFDGEYAMKSLSTHPLDYFAAGQVSDAENTSINHIHTYLDRRSGLPRAVLSSNDCYTHILDCMSNTFLSHHNHIKPVNCAATSPDTRLRVLVRDAKHPLLIEADTGKRIGKLSGHSDFGFACDWSGDGRHIATGAQDGLVNIYD
ncbi:MAG: hypothetical protein Q9211_005284, partial [Gyalolechia sp. 1 TL-2023]